MPNTLKVRALPAQKAGLTLTTIAKAWEFTPWKVIAQQIPYDIYIQSLTFEMGFVLAADDTTYEHLFEIGLGLPHNATTIIQIPHSVRRDTNVGFYLSTVYTMFLPEPVLVTALETICVRMARATATAVTYNGIKIMYQCDKMIADDPISPNNYQFVTSGSGMSVSEKIR